MKANGIRKFRSFWALTSLQTTRKVFWFAECPQSKSKSSDWNWHLTERWTGPSLMCSKIQLKKWIPAALNSSLSLTSRVKSRVREQRHQTSKWAKERPTKDRGLDRLTLSRQMLTTSKRIINESTQAPSSSKMWTRVCKGKKLRLGAHQGLQKGLASTSDQSPWRW